MLLLFELRKHYDYRVDNILALIDIPIRLVG